MSGAPGGGAILIPEGAEVPAAPKETPHRVLGEEAQHQQQHVGRSESAKRATTRLEGARGRCGDHGLPCSGTAGEGARDRGAGAAGCVRRGCGDHDSQAPSAACVSSECAGGGERVGRADGGYIGRWTSWGGGGIFAGCPLSPSMARRRATSTMRCWSTPLTNGNWELQVHIADVSHYVRPGTALDLEARLRGTSVYFPDRAVPMLPPQLSSGMCSLRPDEDRLVLSCVMEIDGRGEVLGYEVCEGIIRSAKRMTYTQVQAILDSGTDAAPTVDKAVRAEFADLYLHFERMYELALKLNAKRHRRGSIDFDLPEPVIEFDPEGNMQSIVRSERGMGASADRRVHAERERVRGDVD